MPPVAVQLSYRLGGADGVAVEARKWEWALHELGFSVRRVAGELDDDAASRRHRAPLPRHRPARRHAAPRPAELAAAIAGADLVIVENLCSLPINPDASALAATVLAAHDGRVVFHHHDLPWQRAGLPTPPERPAAPTELAARDHQRPLARAARRTAASTRSRCATRSISIPHAAIANAHAREFGFAPDDVVLLQPTRAIPRKNIPAAIAFAAELARREPDRRRPPLDHRSGGGRLRRRVRAPGRRVGRPRHRRSRRQRRRRVRGRRPHPVPVDVGGVRQPGHRVDRPPPRHRRRQLPGARRAPRLRRAPAVHRRRRRRRRRGSVRPTLRSSSATWSSFGPTARCPTCPDASRTCSLRQDGARGERRGPGRRSGGRASPAGSRWPSGSATASCSSRSSRSSSPPSPGSRAASSP